MNGIHDLGGMHGFGPLAPPSGTPDPATPYPATLDPATLDPNEPVFHTATDGRALALQVVALGAELYNLDEFRRTREDLDATDYLTMTYYQSWAESLGRLLVEKGVVSAQQLDDRHAFFVDHPDAAPAEPIPAADPVPNRRWARSFDYARPSPSVPRFARGDAVRTLNMHPAHHTRLPRYARDKRGVIDAVYGAPTTPGGPQSAYVFPDSSAHGGGL